ncbi:Shedu immune nuclease family protein [Bifidobacterium crudilactis]|uniref:Shedu immune nuclease family protein n=1 Tax=Bifidobacterium crudilactis TaxID=327277 RepID=UPI002647CD61|nr:Shedu immune nuclease family protein [Bifidobacterium crudilactis]MDN5973073.1 DUF4263 domain-containing protein [Bifidobacterium crudilactis]MDN6000286.1 DUF4263 domain-containing protein [Bifidobacterium crudilactis]MDN6208995.1 DUF4263 domain-containing protein [Bifidobacterium crudilactis]MDN6467905.1 DUF4263 domain-containing protein [Bifidobacterium crudilactis]MDN6558655.1 DUF4263 domain-containing protein [Bifidobacterium crudilactis]
MKHENENLNDDDDPFTLDSASYITGRKTDRTYISKGFTHRKPELSEDDSGVPARFVCKVFDDDGSRGKVTLNGQEWLISETPKRRYQVKLLLARDKGEIEDLYIERVQGANKQYSKFHLNKQQTATLIKLFCNLKNIPVQGNQSIRIDDEIIDRIFSDPSSLQAAYEQSETSGQQLRRLIENDANSKDIIAIANRKKVVERFRNMLNDTSFFEGEKQRMNAHGDENIWQKFFEQNPWILGAGLSGQLLISWDKSKNPKLEQTVAGSSINRHGKKTDALLRTKGIISSMVFAEIKKHTAGLLKPISNRGNEYRSGAFAPSEDLAGGIIQLQTTIHNALEEMGDFITSKDDDGADISTDRTYLFRPRAYLVIGSLSELVGKQGSDHVDKIRSFELFRKSINDIEIITYDELLSKAEWMTGIESEHADTISKKDETDTLDDIW